MSVYMEKIFIILLLIHMLYSVGWCRQKYDKDTNVSIDAMGKPEDEGHEAIENPYFPAKEHVSLKVHAEYYDCGFVDETADAEINRIKIYEEGSVYKLTIYIKPNISSWYFANCDVMSMYFYVTTDKIYWILPYAQLEPGGKTINFYDDDELLIKTLDTDEKLKNKGVLELICQEEEMQEECFSIIKEENKITYSYSEIKVSGEPGGEELFVWEKGKGLVEFGIGFGPGPLDVHIDEICEVTEDAREFWIEQSDRRVLQ
ncbi:MAG: hypothetical protein K2N80_03665 [Lachnospiraceae bacterium]|nr:hypothetical protein [Lachnospiraceae bacterium]